MGKGRNGVKEKGLERKLWTKNICFCSSSDKNIKGEKKGLVEGVGEKKGKYDREIWGRKRTNVYNSISSKKGLRFKRK